MALKASGRTEETAAFGAIMSGMSALIGEQREEEMGRRCEAKLMVNKWPFRKWTDLWNGPLCRVIRRDNPSCLPSMYSAARLFCPRM